MQISGNTLPVPVGFFDRSADQPNPQPSTTAARNPDTERENRQQTVEYVLRGEFVDDAVSFDQQNRNPYAQVIDPANERAIAAYNDNESGQPQFAPRQGRLVDLFI